MVQIYVMEPDMDHPTREHGLMENTVMNYGIMVDV